MILKIDTTEKEELNGPTLLSTSRPNLPPDHVLIDIIGHY